MEVIVNGKSIKKPNTTSPVGERILKNKDSKLVLSHGFS